MLTFCPTSRFSSVDLPTFGRPAIAINPVRCASVMDRQPAQYPGGGFLLGGAAACAVPLPRDTQIGDLAGHHECLVVRLAAGVEHAVFRQTEVPALQVFLQ